MKKNVFISSTYTDLEKYRKEVWKLLENYNVNILGMEKFGARKGTPLETCLNEVERADIYIGIIATRFGSIEPKSNKSYTQLEYEKALELEKEILIYLIDEKAEIPIKAFDVNNTEKLNNFKQLLKEKHTVDFFTTTKDLSNRLKDRLDDILTTKKLNKYNEDGSSKLLNKFLLFPKKYMNYEITLKIKLSTRAFPLSKEACKKLGFKFGETIITKLEILEDMDDYQIKYLIISEEKSDFYFNMQDNNEEEIKILGRLIFSDERINNLKALLFDKEKTITEKNPDYVENDIEKLLKSQSIAFDPFGTYHEPKYIYKTEIKKSDCALFLELIKKIDKKPN